MAPVLAFMSYGSAFATLMVCLVSLTLYAWLFIFWLRSRAPWAGVLLLVGGLLAIVLVVVGLRRGRAVAGSGEKPEDDPHAGEGPS